MFIEFGGVVAAVGAVEQALRDVKVDPLVIEAVSTTLGQLTTGLDDESFQRFAKIEPSSFGGSESAADLGFHHDKAYLVIDETLRGVAQDLFAFAKNIKLAAELVAETDSNVAADLRAREQVVQSMKEVVLNSKGDRANQEARNDHLQDVTDGDS